MVAGRVGRDSLALNAQLLDETCGARGIVGGDVIADGLQVLLRKRGKGQVCQRGWSSAWAWYLAKSRVNTSSAALGVPLALPAVMSARRACSSV